MTCIQTDGTWKVGLKLWKGRCSKRCLQYTGGGESIGNVRDIPTEEGINYESVEANEMFLNDTPYRYMESKHDIVVHKQKSHLKVCQDFMKLESSFWNTCQLIKYQKPSIIIICSTAFIYSEMNISEK